MYRIASCHLRQRGGGREAPFQARGGENCGDPRPAQGGRRDGEGPGVAPQVLRSSRGRSPGAPPAFRHPPAALASRRSWGPQKGHGGSSGSPRSGSRSHPTLTAAPWSPDLCYAGPGAVCPDPVARLQTPRSWTLRLFSPKNALAPPHEVVTLRSGDPRRKQGCVEPVLRTVPGGEGEKISERRR